MAALNAEPDENDRLEAEMMEAEIADLYPIERHRRKHSKAFLFARNCAVLVALFVLLSFGTSTVSKRHETSQDPLVRLSVESDASVGEREEAAIEYAYPVDDVYASESQESRARRQKKGMRKRPHRKVRSHHPETAKQPNRELQNGAALQRLRCSSLAGI